MTSKFPSAAQQNTGTSGSWSCNSRCGETSTGPLGQGIANAVGFALAEKCWQPNLIVLALTSSTTTYAFLGDGCLMERISHEVCSLASVWKLNKLIALYDDNGISIDGRLNLVR